MRYTIYVDGWIGRQREGQKEDGEDKTNEAYVDE